MQMLCPGLSIEHVSMTIMMQIHGTCCNLHYDGVPMIDVNVCHGYHQLLPVMICYYIKRIYTLKKGNISEIVVQWYDGVLHD